LERSRLTAVGVISLCAW